MHLSTTRRYSSGPIPWDCIVMYGRNIGLDEVVVRAFTAIINVMDTEYLQYVEEKQASTGT